MKLDYLIGYLLLILIGIGFIILAIHSKRIEKKTNNSSLNNYINIIACALMGIFIIFYGLIKIISQ